MPNAGVGSYYCKRSYRFTAVCNARMKNYSIFAPRSAGCRYIVKIFKNGGTGNHSRENPGLSSDTSACDNSAASSVGEGASTGTNSPTGLVYYLYIRRVCVGRYITGQRLHRPSCARLDSKGKQ